jgi:hypothetical protein
MSNLSDADSKETTTKPKVYPKRVLPPYFPHFDVPRLPGSTDPAILEGIFLEWVNMPDELRCDPEVEAEAEARINEESKVRVKKYLDARVIRGMRELGYSDSDIGRIVDMSADEVDEFMRNYVE